MRAQAGYFPLQGLSLSLVLALQSACSADEPIQSPTEPPLATGWQQKTLLQGLHHPWGLVFLPGGDMLITERQGRIRVVRDGRLLEETLAGVPEVFAQGQGGLMDISLHPDFEENSYVYITYAAGTSDSNRTTLSRGILDGMELRDVEVLFEAGPPKSGGQHFGSRIVWLEDGTLLMSIGDGGNPPLEVDGTLAREHGQRVDSTLASIVRLNADGSVPDDNPFLDQEGARPELYTIGHRNIQGMVRDPISGRVWANEHGPRGGDELNLIKAGENYGWPDASYGREYRSGEPVAPHKTLPEMVDPKIVWIPSKAPSGLASYTGDRFPDWRGDLFSGALVGQSVRRIKLDGEEVMGEEIIPIGQRVRDVRQGPDGYLYLLTDQREGELIRIEPKNATAQND